MKTNDAKKTICHFCGTKLTRKHIEGLNRLYCDRCAEPIYENPIPATCLVVCDDRKQLLLVKRRVDPKKGYWCLPGGFIELGETPEEAALRELSEETGLCGRIDRLLGVSTNPGTFYHTILMVAYLVTHTSGTLRPGDDALDAAYFALTRLPQIAFASHQKFIELAQKTESLNIKISNTK